MRKRIKIITTLILVQCIIVIKVYCFGNLKNLTDSISEGIEKVKGEKDKYKNEYDSAKDKIDKIKDGIKDGGNKISTAKEKINEGYNKIFKDKTNTDDNGENDNNIDPNNDNTEEQYQQWIERMGELSPKKYKEILEKLIKYKKENAILNNKLKNIYNNNTFVLITNITIDTE